ncbi:hypothetical protein [Streptomyces sp. NPDC056600]|uniref:hypothetical protein n=1 Tax=Streptomyces sp. NPDC056600 TaxID=3345874 RepID=UPI003681ADC6
MTNLPVPETGEPARGRRRGRKLSEIDARVTGTHRLLVTILRDGYHRDGRTVRQLGDESNFVQGKISELLTGYRGKYPRWEITRCVAIAMGLPIAPLCRLWHAGAREARKTDKWIKGNDGANGDWRAPLPKSLEALHHVHGGTYRAYARVFLQPDVADRVVDQALTVVWARIQVVFAGASAVGNVWAVLRERVMAWADLSTAHGVAASRTLSVRWRRDDLSPVPGLADVPGLPGVFGVLGVPDAMDAEDAPGAEGGRGLPGVAGLPGLAELPGILSRPGGLPDIPDLPEVPGLAELPGLPNGSTPAHAGHHRDADVPPGLPGLNEPAGVRDEFVRLTEQTDLFRAICGLAPRHADVLILRCVLRRSALKTSAVLGTDLGMVGLWGQQALQQLEQVPHFRTPTGGMTT